MAARLIVIEGLDGCGKQTQATKLTNRLNENGIRAKYISFPNYESKSSSLVKMYLNGEISKNANDVNLYAASSFFSMDRYITFKKDIKSFINDYDVLVCDRYTDSNAIYQMAKSDKSEWEQYLKWLYDFEYEKLRLPRPTATIFLYIPLNISQKLMEQRYKKDSGKKDIHEKDMKFLNACTQTAFYLCDKFSWTKVNCLSKEDKLREIDDISCDVYNTVRNILQ